MDALPLLEKLQAIAKLGLYYTKDIYDRQRYEQLLALTAEYSWSCPRDARAQCSS